MIEEIEIITTKPTEYFCKNCCQLRLNLAESINCKNCGSGKLIHGGIGELDKDALLIKYNKNT